MVGLTQASLIDKAQFSRQLTDSARGLCDHAEDPDGAKESKVMLQSGNPGSRKKWGCKPEASTQASFSDRASSNLQTIIIIVISSPYRVIEHGTVLSQRRLFSPSQGHGKTCF